MNTIELFQRLGLALAIGLLIGIERGWREREEADGARTAGIRTYALIGLLGGIWAAMVPVLGAWPLAIAGLGFAATFAVFQWREGVARNDFSVTSTVAGFLTYALGVHAVLGNDMMVTSAAGIATIVLLAARQDLHDFLRRMTWQELRSAVILLTMTFLALPLLPNRTIDPWDTINPYDVWLLTILIAAVSYVGYIAVRVGGSRNGPIYAAMAGALVSSTAVTLNHARLAKGAAPDARWPLASGIAAAWAVSLVRMTVVAAIIDRALLEPLWLPILAATSVLSAAAALFFSRARKQGEDLKLDLKNPFELGTVLVFGLGLAVILLVAKVLENWLGNSGLLPLAAVAGFADVDPITVTAAKMVGSSITLAVAGTAILIAGATNIIAKMVVAIALGGGRFGTLLAATGLAALASGAAAWYFLGTPL
jgi:uncharacterized membrane protein (DUF4010 family)